MARFGLPFCKKSVTRRAVLSWLAAFALFAQALVPLSSALAFDASSGGDFQVICTATGVKTIHIGQDSAPIEPHEVVSCPFCMVHAPGALLLPLTSDAILDHVIAEKPIFVLARANRHANLWRALPRPPRGPPLPA